MINLNQLYYLIYLSMALLISCSRATELAAPLVMCTTTTPLVENTHEKSDELNGRLHQAIAEGLPGVSVWLQSDSRGRFQFTGGKADLATGLDLKICHAFRVASLTKVVTAMGILKLVENGSLRLEDTITGILDRHLVAGIEKVEETTVEELLNHTSGIANYDDHPRFATTILNEPGKPLTADDRLELARGLSSTPDWVMTKYGPSYANTNYVLLEKIMEKQTGRSYEEYLEESVLRPLSMEQSIFSTLEPFPRNCIPGYCDLYDNGSIREVTLFDAQRFSAEGSLIATVKDLQRLFNGLFDQKILRSETMQLMIERQLGLLKESVVGLEGFGHDGQMIGYSAEMWYFPSEGLKIIILANRGRISDQQPSIQIFETLFTDLVEMAK